VRAFIAAGLALAASACATPQTDRIYHDRGGLPAKASVAAVPFYPQEDLYCGPAALAMALSWSGLSVTQDQVAPSVYTPGRDGTLPADMISGARRFGRLAVPVTRLEDVLAELAAGHPVIVFQNLALDWWPQWHFAVATGYDLEAGDLILHSGLIQDHRTALAKFERTWQRAEHWALVVLPPDRLPARADELTVLRAANGLERVERYTEAAIVYGAALQRWPASLGAAMGLGNARYAAGDVAGAEAAFREAVSRRPDVAAAWNNLAHVLAKRGKRDEAMRAAQEAVRRDSNSAAYRATLEEIQRPGS
jgi:tetratricopeptide (TPR) repeat protein